MACLLKRSPYEIARYDSESPCRPGDCALCGWNHVEHELRLARGLTIDENGLKHFTKTKAGETHDSTETP